MPSVSVAIAAYNGALFIEEQLDSILSQLSSQDEIVVSYDRSTDQTLSILMDYKSRFPQVKVLINENRGIAGNFNNAISNCSGDIIFVCDQDDVWTADKKSKVLLDFSEHSCDMVIHNGVHIDSKGNVISEPFFDMYRIGDAKIRNLLKPRYSGCCVAFTKEMAKKILPIPSDIDAYDHWIGTIGEFFGTIYYEKKVLLHHRLHGDNATPTKARPLKRIFKARFGLLLNLFYRYLRRD